MRVMMKVWAVVLLLESASVAKSEDEKPAVPKEYRALICVRYDSNSEFASFEFWKQKIESTIVRYHAFERVASPELKSAPDGFRNAQFSFTVNPLKEAPVPGIIFFEVNVKSKDEHLPAQKLLREVENEVSSLIGNEVQENLAGKNEIELELEQLLAQQLDATMQGIAEDLDERVVRLAREIDLIDQAILGFDARQQIIEQQIAGLGAKIEEAVQQDSIVRSLSKAVVLQGQLVAAHLAEGPTAQQQVSASSIKLAEMQAELARSRREAALAAGGQRLTELQRQVENIAIDRAEAKAKVKYLAQARHSVNAALKLQYERRKLRIASLEESYKKALDTRARIELGIPSFSVVVEEAVVHPTSQD